MSQRGWKPRSAHENCDSCRAASGLLSNDVLRNWPNPTEQLQSVSLNVNRSKLFAKRLHLTLLRSRRKSVGASLASQTTNSEKYLLPQ